jgi:predicted 2-oxoglutarate/Fe(II)-dependent dioxygenase YbiX
MATLIIIAHRNSDDTEYWATYQTNNSPTTIQELNEQLHDQLQETSDVLARTGEITITQPIKAERYHNGTYFTNHDNITIKLERLH